MLLLGKSHIADEFLLFSSFPCFPFSLGLRAFFLPHSTCGAVITQHSETHTKPSVRGRETDFLSHAVLTFELRLAGEDGRVPLPI